MSPCCLAIIVVILVIGFLIAYILYRLCEKIGKIFNKKTEDNGGGDDDDPQHAAVKEGVDSDDDDYDDDGGGDDDDEEKKYPFTFEIVDSRPVLRQCNPSCGDYNEFCNLQICRHVMSKAKIDSDKNTEKNVVYIHANRCLIVFMQSSGGKTEDETHEDDINYINSYASKYLDVSVHCIFFDRQQKTFVDSHNNHHHHVYTIDDDNDGDLTRNLFQITPNPSTQLYAPSAPYTSGNFIYIPKQ
ncbi:hypothetical protein MdSGHV035 [Musca domestica salivary gland hypertrophy virus]|uniref:Uncharacterized protein n=1 Tax=Musca hytrovirus(isolate Musca domestica/United States/Boucias/-) TaxID=523909 RepID=B2YG12_MHVB|nr:hypothetical protein MdSGHV035 [Musca domestica salivary gland hypertrophy virus]ACD03494.1 hypothetical protein MdSGHV035 [Musca domestica salivary gland hypertrophy virus]